VTWGSRDEKSWQIASRICWRRHFRFPNFLKRHRSTSAPSSRLEMFRKAFRPPLLKQRTDDGEPPQKKARLSNENDQQLTSSADQPRRALLTIANPAGSEKNESGNGLDCHYTVLWYILHLLASYLTNAFRRKPSGKKHKTWDGDGVLSIVNGYASLKDVSGRDMGRVAFKSPLLPGSTL